MYDQTVTIRVPGGERLRGRFFDRPGPVGVFVHGFRSSIAGVKSQAFAEHAVLRDRAWLRVDLRGHGDSDGSFSDFRLSRALSDLDSILSWLGPRRVVLVGSSMGGWLSALAAQRRPGSVAGMLLIAPALNFIRDHLGSMPPARLEAWQAAGRREFTDLYDGSRYSLDYAVLADAEPLDVLRDHAPRFDCAVEMVHGERDEVVPLEVSRRLLRWLRPGQGRLSVVAGADHRVSEAVPLMRDRLDALWASAGSAS